MLLLFVALIVQDLHVTNLLVKNDQTVSRLAKKISRVFYALFFTILNKSDFIPSQIPIQIIIWVQSEIYTFLTIPLTIPVELK